ncbi:MAG TPA: YceI family protein, partial [Planctomycetota bacterium]|nr:YceI family protein [Planctomycetota bacterium]
MSRCRVCSVLGASAALVLLLAFVPQTKPAPARTDAAPAAVQGEDPSGSYDIDPVHSSAVFRVKHMNVSWFYGRFNQVSGRIVLDTAHPEKSSVEVTIPVASIDTNNEKRNQHLMSPDFFSGAEFPDIGFKSEKVKQLKPGSFEVTGTMSLHGESKPVTATVELAGSSAGGGRHPAVA